MALLLTGCHSDASEAAVARILIAMAASAAIKAKRDTTDTDFLHFVRKRIRWLVGENGSWDAAPGYDTLTTRLNNEMVALDAYLDAKLGKPKPDTPGPLGGATDPAAFPHLDFEDVSKIYTDDDQTVTDDRKAKYIEARRRRVRRIAWRATAIHPTLWAGSSSDTSASLKTAALDELVDRRLRFVERMRYGDYSQGDRNLVWKILGASSWKNNMRTSLLEYPFVHLNPQHTDGFSTAVADAGLTLAALNPQWELRPKPDDELRFLSTGRVRPTVTANWDLSRYAWTMKLAGRTPAQIFDLMLPSTPLPADLEDFWNRNWMFCDHTAAALEVEALRLGLRRRTGNDDQFNTAASSGVTLHVPIPESSKPSPDDVMDAGSDYFEGAMIDGTDLQIGDLLIIWNNFFLRVVWRTDFGLENSIIADITGDNPEKAMLVGHGAPEDSYASFVGGLVDPVQAVMHGYRGFITRKIEAEDPAHDYVVNGVAIKLTAPFRLELVYWDPFDERCVPADAAQKLQVPGAWWMRVKLADAVDDGQRLTLASALNVFPKSVAIDTSIHTPPKFLENHDSDYKESIYIPFSVPKGVNGGWKAYFDAARAEVKAGLPGPIGTRLVDVKVDVDWAPGFHYAGPGTKIPVLRPKVRL